LFAGTELGIYYSIDRGASWRSLNNNLPTVAVYDVLVLPRDHDLIVATHGRGFWIMDDITPLQQLTPPVQTADGHLFENRVATQWLRIQPQGTGGSFGFRGENPTRSAVINYHIGPSASGEVRFEVTNSMGTAKRTYAIPAKAGVNRLEWDMRYDPTPEQIQRFKEFDAQRRAAGFGPGGPGGGGGGGQGGRFGQPQEAQGDPAPPGEYRITMTVNGKTYSGRINVRRDPLVRGGMVTTDF
jgi:hypothetical protein